MATLSVATDHPEPLRRRLSRRCRHRRTKSGAPNTITLDRILPQLLPGIPQVSAARTATVLRRLSRRHRRVGAASTRLLSLSEAVRARPLRSTFEPPCQQQPDNLTSSRPVAAS